MKKSLEMAGGFLATQLNYIPALMAILTIYFGIMKMQPDIGKLVLLGLLPFGFYLIRYFVQNLIGFFALHLLWAALPYFFADNEIEKIFFILTSIVFFGMSVYFKVAKKQIEDSILFAAMSCIIAIISYFAALSGYGEAAAGTIATLTIVYIVFYMLYQYIKGYLSYIKNNEVSNQNIPKIHIFKTSFSTMVGFLTLFVGFALLLVKGNLFADLIYKIGDLLKRFIIWLLSFAPEAMEQGEAVEEIAEATENLEGLGGETQSLYQLSPEIMELIDNIVTIGAYIISGIAILLITYGLFRAIMAAFKVKREVNEEEVVLVKDKVTKIERRQKVKKEKQSQFTKERKIRKLYEDLIYKKTVEGKRNKQEKNASLEKLKYQTPKEQCKGVQKKEDIQSLYEKARYSDSEITKEDVKQMKKICIY